MLVRFLISLIAVFSALMGLSMNAQAHSLHVFAMGNGDIIDGYTYFGGGARPHNGEIQLLDRDDKLLFTGTTDDQGEFRIRISHRQDYVIKANSGDGHIAEFTINGDELSSQLPKAAQDSEITVSEITGTAITPKAPAPIMGMGNKTETDGMIALSRDELADLIDAAVARHVRPLREQLVAYEDKVRFSDLLGGIGIIIGIFGVFAWVKAGRNQRNTKP